MHERSTKTGLGLAGAAIVLFVFVLGLTWWSATSASAQSGPGGTELVFNGDFDRGSLGWWSVGTESGVDGSSGELCATAPATAQFNWSTQVGQGNITVVGGERYRLSFAIEANAGVTVGVAMHAASSPWGAALRTAEVIVGTTATTQEIEFVADQDVTQGLLLFKLGSGQRRAICIDDVSLQQIPNEGPGVGTELLNNPNYDSGSSGWWDVGVTPTVAGGEACLAIPSGTVNPWDAMWGQSDIPLTSGQRYRVQIRSRANVATSIPIVVQKTDAPYTAFSTSVVSVSTGLATASFDFTATTSWDNASIVVNLGDQPASSVCIDQLSLQAVADSQPGTEVMFNGDFSRGVAGWWAVGPAGSPVISGGEYCVNSPASSVSPWVTQVGQSRLEIVPGTTYELSFDLRANAPARIAAVIQQNTSPWTAILNQEVSVTNAPQRFRSVFTGDNSVSDALLTFRLGTGTARTYCFDNVSLRALGSTGPGTGVTPEEHLATILSNPTRNTQFDDNQFRGVPMSQIQVSDLTVNDDLYNEALLDTSTSGYFRVKCEVSHFAYDDPIVFPDQPGRAHLHMFFGNTEANAFSTFDSLLNNGTGTCNGADLNRTSYWIPAMLDNQGNALIPFELMVYYKNDNFRLNGANELVGTFPDNLRMVVGQAMSNQPQTTLSGGSGSLPVVSFNCGPAYGQNQLQALIPDCYGTGNGNYGPNGRALEMKIAFPQCFNPNNGTYLPNGSHMTYSEGGYYGARCPDSHPYDVSSIMYRIFFSPDEYGGALTDLRLSSDVRPDGTILPGGTTAHADWFGAWHPDAMAQWVQNCNNTQADCEIGLLGRDPMVSLVPRDENFYPYGYRAPAEELIQLCPGRQWDPANRLESVANCTTGRLAPQ